MTKHWVILGIAVILALVSQVSELHAFDSPVPTPQPTEAPPPPRPTPPAVRRTHESKGESRAQVRWSEQVPLTLASVDGASLMWAWVVETGD